MSISITYMQGLTCSFNRPDKHQQIRTKNYACQSKKCPSQSTASPFKATFSADSLWGQEEERWPGIPQ